jgi:hypothetical protein
MPLLSRIIVSLALPSLGGCALDSNAWLVSRYKEQVPFIFEPDQAPRKDTSAPDAKALIAANPTQVFGRTKIQDVQVASPRRIRNIWETCVRAQVFGITGQSLGQQYFIVEFDRDQIGLRRPATRDDNCENESFEAI